MQRVLKPCYHDPGGFLYPCSSHILGKRLSQRPETTLITFLYIKVFIPKYFSLSSCIMLIKGFWDLYWGLMDKGRFPLCVYIVGRTPSPWNQLIQFEVRFQSLGPTLSRGEQGVKNNYMTRLQITQFSLILNEYEIQHFN